MRKSIGVVVNALMKWKKDYRAWLVFGIAAICVCNFVEPVFKVAARWGYAVTPWIFPFIDSQPFMKMIIYLGIILLFSNAPFLYQDQIFVIARSGRRAYAVGELGAVAIMTMLYFLGLMCVPVIVYAGKVGWSKEWGDVLFTAANTNALSQEGGVGTIIINLSIIENLTPLQAMALSYCLHVLTGIMLGYLVYLGNVTAEHHKWIGVFIAGVLVILDPIFKMFKFKWSPVSWGDLDKLDYVKNGARLSVTEVVLRLCIVIGLAALFCIKRTCHLEIRAIEE